MVTEKSWDEFRDTGLVLIVNQILHIFGWAITFEVNEESGKVIRAYPARVKFRGFSNGRYTQAYRQITQYMSDNIEELKKEAFEEEN